MQEQDSVSVKEVVAASIERLRKSVGLTQEDLAEAMSAAGFSWSRTTVAEIESGGRALALDELITVASYFEIPVWFMLLGVGAPLPTVRVGYTELEPKEWVALVMDLRVYLDDQGRTHIGSDVSPEAPARSVIDKIWRGIERPWSRIWRRSKERRGGPAFMRAREELLRGRRRFPGPTYVYTGEGNLESSTAIAPWGMELRIKLEPGRPYVARDDAEAALLAGLEESRDDLERIPAYKAFRMRGSEVTVTVTDESGKEVRKS